MNDRSEYEFTDDQNETLRVLSSRMKWVGWFLAILGVFVALGLLTGSAETVPELLSTVGISVIYFLIGFWTIRAANSFTQITVTKGSDVTNLMDALSELRKLYTLQFWLIITALFLLGIGIVVGIVSNIAG